MKKLLLIALMATGITGAFAQTRKVKFSVDMTGQTVSGNGVHVAGGFQSWSPSTTALTQEGSTNIYSVVADVTENSVVEYKFINGNDWPQAEGVPAFSQKGNSVNGGSNDNRWAFVAAGTDTLDLGAITFGGSAPSGKYAVRLAVDMAKEASVSSNGVSVAGDFQGWSPGKTRMANLFSSDNKIYEVIIYAAAGTYGYKFINGNAWGSDESVPSGCATSGNRTITVGSSNETVGKVCYGSCSACPSAPIPKYNITFRVDLSTTCDFDTVDIAGGKINGWGGGTFLTKGANGIWSVTLLLDSSEIQYKYRKIKKGVVSWEGVDNRVVTPYKDTTLALHCFDKNTICTPVPSPSDITFKVDLTNEIIADSVFVIGSFTSPQWQAGKIKLMPDAGNSNYYSATVSKLCPGSFFYKFCNGDPNAVGEDFPDTTQRSCNLPNGLGGFNRTYTRTSASPVELFFVYNTCKVGGTTNTVELTNEVSIAPNPAVGSFNVSLAGSKINKIVVTSLDGRVVRSLSANDASINVNVNGLNGIYLVNITDNLGRNATKKIVLQ